ncbi:MAG TPA: indolepyruvate oxidoreductase subunit beta [Oscillospiraceae bacterium]|nr:indolepyruvate oxidoreductase subunit beta [Oscillospiraceae bacterium]HNW05313.1 indolepyruvate oxidoreductase subunit beta [Oscillospiraceae bacterium]HPW00730.1 indolepyruvate oxidoreductase subunit beta [Oscillospiraceae bacterium]
MACTNIMIVGVGGQGTLLASRILGDLLMKKGYDVKISEVHGMSQRGGSVVTYVKYGDAVASPTVEEGCADYILAFERCEAARWLPYLKKGGALIAADQRIDPMPVITGAASYPEEIFETIRALGVDLTVVDAVRLAEKAGSAKAANVVLIGALSRQFRFTAEEWEASIEAVVPENFRELNLKAFRYGRESEMSG